MSTIPATTTTAATAAAIALLALAAPGAAAQAIAYGGEPRPIRGSPPALAERYHVRLESAWPSLPAGAGCENGGAETVEGTLTRTGPDDYAGSFVRTTHLLFCGAHGADARACGLVLDGDGRVGVRGMVVADERSPSGRALRMVWTPDAAHAARVGGGCGGDFERKIERMYLSARHSVEFALPAAGAAPRRERLEDYAWVVEIE